MGWGSDTDYPPRYLYPYEHEDAAARAAARRAETGRLVRDRLVDGAWVTAVCAVMALTIVVADAVPT